MTQTSTTAAAQTTFDSMTERSDWLGFGYLGERGHALNDDRGEMVRELDALILAEAASRGWSADALFTWANSKNGRWMGDVVLGGTGPVACDFASAVGFGLLSLPR